MGQQIERGPREATLEEEEEEEDRREINCQVVPSTSPSFLPSPSSPSQTTEEEEEEASPRRGNGRKGVEEEEEEMALSPFPSTPSPQE